MLQRLAEVDPGDDIDDVTTPSQDGFLEAHDGLHAKTFIIDTANSQSTIVTGSANLRVQHGAPTSSSMLCSTAQLLPVASKRY